MLCQSFYVKFLCQFLIVIFFNKHKLKVQGCAEETGQWHVGCVKSTVVGQTGKQEEKIKCWKRRVQRVGQAGCDIDMADALQLFFPSQELTCVTFDLPCLHFSTPDGTKQLPSLVSCPLLTCNRSAGPPGWNWWRSCVPLHTWLSNQFIPIPENGGKGGGLTQWIY